MKAFKTILFLLLFAQFATAQLQQLTLPNSSGAAPMKVNMEKLEPSLVHEVMMFPAVDFIPKKVTQPILQDSVTVQMIYLSGNTLLIGEEHKGLINEFFPFEAIFNLEHWMTITDQECGLTIRGKFEKDQYQTGYHCIEHTLKCKD